MTTAAALLTLLAVPLAADQLTGRSIGDGGGPGLTVDPIGRRPPPAPPAGVDAAERPLGHPPSVGGDGGFTFLHVTPDDDPVAPDPCRAIRLVVAGRAAPGAPRAVEDAASVLSTATGLRLQVEGTTTEEPDDRRASYQPGRYGRRWAPVLVAWTDPRTVPGLEGAVAGLAAPAVRMAPNGQQVIVTGQVTLDRPQIARLARGPQGEATARAVVMHELAHVLGLDHVDDPTSLMHARGSALGPNDGDRRGLAALGRGPCVPAL